jgi:signal transduction histidine kinase
MYVDAPSEDRPLNPGLLQMEARAAVTDVVDGIRFTGSFAEFDGEVPGAVALAIVGALGEAARNSVRHAGSASVRREMRMSAEVGRVIVEFDDDGPGFDPSKVEDRRFGIRGGIRARVEEIGGVATITSAPGSGATVRIVWPCATQ